MAYNFAGERGFSSTGGTSYSYNDPANFQKNLHKPGLQFTSNQGYDITQGTNSSGQYQAKMTPNSNYGFIPGGDTRPSFSVTDQSYYPSSSSSSSNYSNPYSSSGSSSAFSGSSNRNSYSSPTYTMKDSAWSFKPQSNEKKTEIANSGGLSQKAGDAIAGIDNSSTMLSSGAMSDMRGFGGSSAQKSANAYQDRMNSRTYNTSGSGKTPGFVDNRAGESTDYNDFKSSSKSKSKSRSKAKSAALNYKQFKNKSMDFYRAQAPSHLSKKQVNKHLKKTVGAKSKEAYKDYKKNPGNYNF